MDKFFEIGTKRAPILAWKTGKSMRSRYTEKQDVLDLLRECLAHDPSDIHITSGHPVLLEIHGELRRLTEHAFEWGEFESVARVLRDKEGATTILSQQQDYDDAFVMTDASGVRRRLRVNMTAIKSIRSTQAGSLVLRPLQDVPPPVQSIGVPQALLDKCYPPRGGVYVIGPTGSGKTTLFASLIRHAAESGCAGVGHLATYESPPEFDLEALSSEHLLITQCAIDNPWGLKTFQDGGRNALRRHPKMVLIGEIRDYETVSAAVELSLTGHPVYGTLHADSPSVAFQRLITRYPVEQQSAGMYDLIMTTEVIIAQRLVRKKEGGRTAVREWIAIDDEMRLQLMANATAGAVATAIRAMVQSPEYREAGKASSFAFDAQKLLDEGVIAPEEAAAYLKR